MGKYGKMKKNDKTKKNNGYIDFRIVLSDKLGQLFRDEAKSQKRKQSAHMAYILEKHYNLIKGE